MSGTSADGIDAAVVRIRGGDGAEPLAVELLVHHHAPFDAALRSRVLALAGATPSEVALLHVALGQRCAQAARAALERAGLGAGEVAAVASAGLTAAHLPPGPEARARRCRSATATSSRPAPAAPSSPTSAPPTAPPAGTARRSCPGPTRCCCGRARVRAGAPVAALNLGGIGNLTLVPPEGDPIAFDTGPGNMLLDGALARRTAGRTRFDEGGALGCVGRVDAAWLERSWPRTTSCASRRRARRAASATARAWLARHAARIDALRAPDLAAHARGLHRRGRRLAIDEQLAPRGAQPVELVVSGGGALNPLPHALPRAATAGPRGDATARRRSASPCSPRRPWPSRCSATRRCAGFRATSRRSPARVGPACWARSVADLCAGLADG
jgi:anhydro-N-acetylmuramic acid kinase